VLQVFVIDSIGRNDFNSSSDGNKLLVTLIVEYFLVDRFTFGYRPLAIRLESGIEILIFLS
jgi:hypothetical protein